MTILWERKHSLNRGAEIHTHVSLSMIPYASNFTRLPQLDLQFKSGGIGSQGRKASIWLWSKHQKGKKDKNKEEEGR